jgi:hypothetical protein
VPRFGCFQYRKQVISDAFPFDSKPQGKQEQINAKMLCVLKPEQDFLHFIIAPKR